MKFSLCESHTRASAVCQNPLNALLCLFTPHFSGQYNAGSKSALCAYPTGEAMATSILTKTVDARDGMSALALQRMRRSLGRMMVVDPSLKQSELKPIEEWWAYFYVDSTVAGSRV